MTRSARSPWALVRWGTVLAVLLLADGQRWAAGRQAPQPVPRQRDWLAQPLGARYTQTPAQVWEWIDEANALEAKGANGQVAALWEKVLAWREKAQGPDHAEMATGLSNLGLLYVKERAFTRAEPLLARALAIRTRVLGPDHPLTALSLNNLAWLHHNQNNHANAEPLYWRALVMMENGGTRSEGGIPRCANSQPIHPDKGASISCFNAVLPQLIDPAAAVRASRHRSDGRFRLAPGIATHPDPAA